MEASIGWRNPEGQIARWLEILGPFDFDIEHRSGVKHSNADGLSRIPCTQCGDGVESDENSKSEDLRAKARKIVETIKNQRRNLLKKESKSIAEDKSFENTDHDISHDKLELTQKHELVKPGIQAITNEHNYAFPKPNSDDSDRASGAQSQNSSRSSCPDHSEPDDTPEDHWLRGYTKAEIGEMQKKDENIAYIINKKLENSEKPKWEDVSPYNPAIKALWANWDRLKVDNGVLYRKFEKENQVGVIWQLVLPGRLVNTVLAALHDGPQACHLGEEKTIGAVQRRVYFYGYKRAVIDWLKKCHLCNSKKPSPKLKRAPLVNYVLGAPLEKVSLDIAGPFPVSEGNKYILVIGDYFTKYIIAKPIPDLRAETVAKVLVHEWILRLGTPRIIHSDRGTQFTSNVFKEMCKLLGVRQTLNSAYHPRENGQIERMNETIERLLAMTVNKTQSDWASKLSYVMSAYRATPHKTTGLSPNQLMFGREFEVPIDLLIGRPKDPIPKTYLEFNELQRENFEIAHKIARKNIQNSAVSQKRYYDVNVKGSKFEVGTRVWCTFPVTKPKLSPKLNVKWQGPFTITECVGDVNYKIRLNPRSKVKLVHRDRLNLYRGPNDVPDPPVQRVTPPGSTTETASESSDEERELSSITSLPETIPYGSSEEPIEDDSMRTKFGRTVRRPGHLDVYSDPETGTE